MAENFPFWTRAGWQKAFKLGRVLVDKKPIRASQRLKTGDRLYLYYPNEVEPEVDDGIQVLWEEGGVMAVYKPSGLPMHENGPYRKNTFARFLIDKVGRDWSAVHRLDRETSGIVLCAEDPQIRKDLTAIWMQRKVQKTYHALVNGVPSQPSWFVDAPIDDLKESQIRIKKWVVEGGLPAQTSFRALEVGPAHTWIEAKPITGRTNQIRIHAAYSGHTLVGDKLFHPNEHVFLEHFEKGNTDWVVAEVGHPRLCLHAAALSFFHPRLREERTVESPLPDDMAALWQRLKSQKIGDA